MEIFQRGVRETIVASRHALLKAIALKHIGLSSPAVGIWYIGQRERQTGDFQSKGVWLRRRESLAKVLATRFMPTRRKQFAQQPHRRNQETGVPASGLEYPPLIRGRSSIQGLSRPTI